MNFLKVSRLSPFVLPLQATCTGKSVSNTGTMIGLTERGNPEVLREKHVPVLLC
jgi:hypothetical protein